MNVSTFEHRSKADLFAWIPDSLPVLGLCAQKPGRSLVLIVPPFAA